jgi:hypothetical protein
MQASRTFRETGFSKSIALVVIAIASALLLGGAAGYASRTVTPAANSSVVAQPAVQISQGGPDSDLTRALPTAAPKVAPDRGPQPDHGLIP